MKFPKIRRKDPKRNDVTNHDTIVSHGEEEEEQQQWIIT